MIQSIQIVSPHQDDAAFSLGSLMLNLTQAGIAVQIVNCFTVSDYAPLLHGNLSVSEVRHSEDCELAARLGGDVSIVDLGYLDSPLRLGISCDEVCDIRCDLDPARGVLSGTLRGILTGPTILPLGLGGHVDHVLARDEALHAVRDFPIAFYEDLPYACRSVDVERDAGGVLSACGLEASMYLCSTSDSSLKRSLIGAYKSQVSPSGLDGIADYRGGDECLWMNREFKHQWLQTGLHLA